MGFDTFEVFMKKAVFMYPGQGSQSVGMGVSVFEAFEEARIVFKKASVLSGFDMLSLCTDGPAEKLSRTLYTQPALFTVEAALTEVLKAYGRSPACVAGHSLGEFSALYTAGVYTFEDGFQLVSERGRLMDSADPEGRGTMAAVIGLDPGTVGRVCESVEGTVVVANINSPLQVVISGEKGAVSQAGAILQKDHGAKRVIPLIVSGAFHSPLMVAAQDRFVSVIEKILFFDAAIPVYSNVTALPVTKAEEIRKNMVLQLTSPVRWTEIVSSVIDNGIDEAYEVGPGNVLAGLVKRTDERLRVRPVSDYSSLMEVLNEEA
jgi:[acyl-carrier-protein] S-malonyltransferase